MSGKHELTREHAARMLAGRSVEAMMRRLAPDTAGLPAVPPGGSKVTVARARALWAAVNGPERAREVLLDAAGDELAAYGANIENGIGLLKLPLGLAGPLRVNGTAAKIGKGKIGKGMSPSHFPPLGIRGRTGRLL